MILHAWEAWLKLASLTQEKICLAFGSSVLFTLGTLHSARGAMVDLSHESGPKSEAGRGRHCCSDAENGDSPRMFASIMQMIV